MFDELVHWSHFWENYILKTNDINLLLLTMLSMYNGYSLNHEKLVTEA